jgi:hypothetical protein
MKPKEKAEALVNTMFSKIYENGGLSFKIVLHSKAIECVLIAIEEIILEICECADEDFITPRLTYWKEVKEEVEKLD